MSFRVGWVDSLKGLGIALIVLGHSFFPFSQYIYWFHVPLFYILSGFVLKTDRNSRVFIKKKINSMVKPYFGYGISIIFLSMIIFKDFIHPFKQILFLCYSGRVALGVIGTFWFIPTLLLAEVAAFFLLKKYSYKKTVILSFIFYIAMFCFVHFILKDKRLPWDINVVPIALLFMLFGYFLKDKIPKFNKNTLVMNFLFLLIILLVNKLFHIEFLLDLKNYTASHFIEDILIPITICMILIQSFSMFNFFNSKALIKLGRNSLVIMFVSNFFIKLITTFFTDNWLLVFVFSLTCSYIISISATKLKMRLFKEKSSSTIE